MNTARIAQLGLAQCQVHAVADITAENMLPADVKSALENALLIYPGKESSDVAELDPATIATRPLIVLDASWRKSKRMLLASEWLQTLPRISFELAASSRYRIRKEPAAHYCSSLEAICTVLGTLERDREKYAALLSTMDAMVDQQVAYMGDAVYRRNYRANGH